MDTFFELLKNKFLTWIASPDKKVEECRTLCVVDSGKFVHSGRLRAPAVYLVYSYTLGIVSFEKPCDYLMIVMRLRRDSHHHQNYIHQYQAMKLNSGEPI